MSDPIPVGERRCLNCEAALTGPYCAACGQRDRDPDVSLRELAREAVETFSNLDGSVASSFAGLLWPPGRLTRDVLAGRRARYLPPLRLYLLCSLAFVLARGLHDQVVGAPQGQVLKVSTSIERDDGTKTVISGDSAARMLLDSTSAASGELGTGVWGRMLRGALADPAGMRQRVRDIAPRAFFVLVPTFALLLGLGFRRERWRFPRHLVVAMHLHAAGFLVFGAGQLASSLPGIRALENSGPMLVLLAFVPLALRTIYGSTTRRAALVFVGILVPYLLVVAAAIVAVFALAALGGG